MDGNWMTTERVIKQFYINEDLTYKANDFISLIDQMEGCMTVINTTMQNELSKQQGLMIEALQQEATKNYELNRTYNGSFRQLMNQAAQLYDNQIFEMSSQDLTLFIEYIKMNQDD